MLNNTLNYKKNNIEIDCLNIIMFSPYRKVFNIVKSIIPKISETEIIALKSGGVSIDREIFNGKVDYSKLYKPLSISSEKNMETEINELLRSVGSENIYPNKNIHKIIKQLGEKGFLSMIIDKKYNGNRLSITSQSKILSKISSYNPSLAVTAMVPNSLGPAELLQHYGTEQQKKYFLPKLADGTMIPCFGLTGPNNGSDAVGQIDKGIVECVDGKIKIKITLNKRYITLAPVSNVIGIAFNTEDPNGLLKNNKTGITVALVESSQYGLQQHTYHNPNNAGFPNGTIKGTIFIDPDQTIGGEDKIGEGWKMLMECLAVGRGVSLPATANGTSKFVTHSIMNYINLRKQFNMNIGNMESVREKFIDMYLNTWIIHTSVNFTNHILDSGSTPSVITAIMKQQTTERARNILNNGMDIYAGSGICVGENNFFTKFYNSSPVGITVEGSNTLTRGLIIFGQGLNKSHPYIFPIFQSIQENNLDGFKYNMNKLVSSIVVNYCKLISITWVNSIPFIKNNTTQQRLDIATLKFSLLTNFVALMGGKIKSKQMISGNMSDILSNLYLSYSVLWYYKHYLYNNEINNSLRDECINYLMNELDYKMNLIIENYPFPALKPLLYPLTNRIKYSNLENKNKLYTLIINNEALHKIFKDDIYYEGTVLEKMEKLRKIKPNSEEYNELYQDIIQVGEYKIQ
jgi:acyl-CoA dehydrogenase